MNKKIAFRHILLLSFGFFLLPYGCKMDNKAANQGDDHSTLVGENNLAYRWGTVILQATANDTERFRPRPTVTSRYLGLICTSVFDAWSRYDAKATPVYLNGVERRPETEQTILNKEKAISYAAYRALNEYFYSDTAYFRQFMVELGLDPNNQSTDPSTPEGIGNLAAKAVIEARKGDGSNMYGEEEGSNGVAYFDYTHYEPVNTPDKLNDVIRWQAKYFSDGKGGKFSPTCLTPMWGKVKPLALKSSDQFRSPPPPQIGSKELEADVKATVEYQANMTDEHRALVEFMRDGPTSVQQAGHWLIFARNVSVRDQHTLDQDVKMYFLVEATAMDGFIACWDTKMHYDYARPYCLIHHYYDGKEIQGWAGPEKGQTKMKGNEWRPYSPDSFLCPPFPAYVSGHSTISGGCAEVLKLFTGSDVFGEKVKLVPGSMTEPNRIGDTVTLNFPTFTQTADMAGISRVMGGYHIPVDNTEGLTLGRKVGNEVYKWYLGHIGEVATN
jgi:hypothetical protein